MKIILKKSMFIIIIIYGIIGVYHTNYAVAAFSYKVVKNSNAGPITNVAEYEICTDALMYHISANGYDKKIGDPCDDNFSIAGVGSSNSLKAKGYGWYTYKLKSLQGLIEYCHSKNPTITDDKSNITIGIEPYTVDYNYNILVNLSESSLSKTSKDVMKRFWEGMYSAIQNEFIEYQDSYFFRENTLKAIDKIRGTLNSEGLEANNLSERNLSRNRTDYPTQSKKEYLTLLTTYMYSINREEKLASVGKGDLVPFLYYAEHTDETDPYIIGKYAYIALVYEFLRVSGTNYWTAEFDRIYFNNTGFADSEIFEEYDIETLEQWYDETYEKYKNDRGVKQNPLIGSDIDTIISSNYTINYQVEATKDYVENIYAELGIDMIVDDFMAKNALMAEYMMQNSNFDDVIKDYNVSIKFVVDNLQRGTFEEKNGTTAVLSDFQTIEFDNTIKKVANQDKDSDSLTNKSELGDTKWQDITGFVEKMYIFKYGTNMTMYESKVDEMVINNGGYTDFNGNFVYGHVKKEKDLLGNIKVFYRVYDYKSNPALKDTDFDGMDDNADGRPKDNKFHGTAKIEKNQNLNVDYYNDYRHFFIDNNKYNSELAEMSLMISNLANDESRNLYIYQGGDSYGISTAGRLLIGNMNITEYLPKIGFNPLGNISLYDGDGKCYLYYKIINYYGEERLVFGIFIGGFNNERAYRELVVINDSDKYQSISSSIVNQVNTLKNISSIKQYFENNKYCYWITGKNISGSIATGVATKLEGSHNIYCYTYGVPNVKGTSTLTYIKNIVNEDDLLPKIKEDIGQEGDVYNKSIYWDLIPEYRHYVESPNKYKGNFKRTNTVKKGIDNALNSIIAWGTEEMKNTFNNDLSYYVWLNINGINETENSFFANTASNLITLNKDTDDIMAMREYKDEVSSGNSTKAYWCLVKTIDGYDSKYYYTRDNNEVYDKKEEKAPDSGNVKLDDEYDHIYIEIDWDRRYPPDKAQLELVAESFRQHNIMLHIDAGEYSVNYNEEEIHKYGKREGGALKYLENGYAINAESLERIVRNNFSFREKFRYCMYVDKISYDSDNEPYGRADAMPGRMFQINKLEINDEIKKFGIVYRGNLEGNIFAHELGHTLGLHHGGDEDINYKPNYVSIMNYSYAEEGLYADNVCNYSEFDFPEIRDFNHMDERKGIDRYNINDKVFEYRWLVKNDDGSIYPGRHNKLLNSLNGYHENEIDFNNNQIIEEDVNVNFYIKFDYDVIKQISFDNLGMHRNCNASINDWQIVYRNIIPPESINYSAIWH